MPLEGAQPQFGSLRQAGGGGEVGGGEVGGGDVGGGDVGGGDVGGGGQTGPVQLTN